MESSLRNYEKANHNYRNALGRYHALGKKLKFWNEASQYYMNANYQTRSAQNARNFKTAHAQMINAHNRRTRAFMVMVTAWHRYFPRRQFNWPKFTKQKMVNTLYAPPRSPGGIGGVEFERMMLRYRKRPARAVSASPRRRTTPRRPHSV